MSFIKKLFSKDNEEKLCVMSPVSGSVIPITEIDDEIFSKGVLGYGIAVKPTEGKLYAPIRGTVESVAETGHAIGIAGQRVELLVHIGVDTVSMNGRGFRTMVKEGDTVSAGQCIAQFDIAAILEANLDPSVILIITNPDQMDKVTNTESRKVKAGEPLLWVEPLKR